MTNQPEKLIQVEARDPQAHPSYPIRHPRAAHPFFEVISEEPQPQESSAHMQSPRPA